MDGKHPGYVIGSCRPADICSVGSVVSILQDKLIVQCLLGPLALLGWFMVWTSWLGCKTSPWMRISASCLTLALIASNGQFTLYPNAVAFNIASLLARFCLFVLLFVSSFKNMASGLEGWLILPAAILLMVGAFGNDLSLLLDLPIWYFWGEKISLHKLIPDFFRHCRCSFISPVASVDPGPAMNGAPTPSERKISIFLLPP